MNAIMFRFMLLAVLLAVACPAQIHAEEDAEQINESTTLDEVEVTAKSINASLDDPPIFVEKIDMKQFEGRFVTTEEVISQAAGVTVRDFGGLGKTSTISIRGSSADQVLVLVDGVRINSAVGGGVDLSSIPPDQIERIEVIRGGDSAFYGDGAMGGVVNIVTKRTDRPINTIGVSYGSFNTFRVGATRSSSHEKLSYLASANYLHTDGDFVFKNNNGTEFNDGDDYDDIRENNETDNRGALLKASYAFDEGVEVAAQNEFFSSDKGQPGMVTFPSPYVHRKDIRNATSLSLALNDLATGGLSLKTRLTHLYTFNSYHDPRGEQTGVSLKTKQHEYAPEAEETIRYIWGDHQIWTFRGLYRLNQLLDEEFENPSRTTWAASLRDQIYLFNDIVTLVPAGRYDHISDMGDRSSPKFGLSIKPVSWLVFKGNAGKSFRAPNFSELYFNQGFMQGNPDLEPESSVNYDAGLQFITERLFLEGAWFRSEVEDLIEYLLISGFRYKPFNIGKARLEGFEGSLRFNPVKYFSLTGSYTLTYALDMTEYPNRRERQIPGRPRHKGFGRAQGRWKIFSPFVELNYVGGNFITQANTKLLAERKIWNVGLVTQPDEHFKVGMEVKNFSDERAVDVRNFPLPGRSFFMNFDATF